MQQGHKTYLSHHNFADSGSNFPSLHKSIDVCCATSPASNTHHDIISTKDTVPTPLPCTTLPTVPYGSSRPTNSPDIISRAHVLINVRHVVAVKIPLLRLVNVTPDPNSSATATMFQPSTLASLATAGAPISTFSSIDPILLLRGGGVVVADYSADAIKFFDSIRTPAALVAGSSLAALFSLVGETKIEEIKKQGRLEKSLLLLYHIFCLTAFGLSMIVVLTSTATGNNLLLGARLPRASSAYEFIKKAYEFEFLTTKLSFFTSLFSFLISVAIRTLIQFDLLHFERLRSAMLVVFTMVAIMFHLLAIVNQSIVCCPNLPAMAVSLFKMFVARVSNGRKPCEWIAMVSLFSAFLVAISLLLDPNVHERKNRNSQGVPPPPPYPFK